MGKKVYLAKSNLASGSDVEYVKSNLLRIPGIEIVEFSSCISITECDAMVIVSPNVLKLNTNTADNLEVEEKIFDLIDEFNYPYESVFVFTRPVETTSSKDVESTTPMCYSLVDYFKEEDENDEDEDEVIISYFIELETFENNLLKLVSDAIGVDDKKWKLVKRHYQPEKEFALPEVPNVERRLAKKYATNEAYGNKPIQLKRRLFFRRK